MDDSEGKSSSDGVPTWQLNAPDDEPTADASQSQEDTHIDKLEVARRFLEDDAVKTAPRHTKVDFLKSKGVEDADIQYLLGEPEDAPSTAKDSAPTDVRKTHAHLVCFPRHQTNASDRSPTKKHCKCWRNLLPRSLLPLPNLQTLSSQAAIGLP